MTTKRGVALAERLHSVAVKRQYIEVALEKDPVYVFPNFGVELLLSLGRPAEEIETDLKEIIGAVVRVNLTQVVSD